ncbi:MAG: MurR/RpiR family transcriptional regulator [Lactobacillus sp.]|jgi:DNA-binding MurR/RpiR family transcriptional regulator|nr:MurR/RpiR family transcriptional regulator [Lactobacillus sp.]MCI2034001.1 MurR/RpiR family transcriptional regulator [Lactobacillus sp.]
MHNFALQFQANRQRLSTKERTLGQFLLQNQQAASTWSISTLSTKTNISTATISRFAKNLGYPNFQSLRLALAMPQGKHQLFEEIGDHDSLLTMADKVFGANIDALQATASNLTENQLQHAVTLLTQAKQVGLYGLGASNLVALDGYHKFLRTPITTNYASDFHMQLMSITRLTPADCAVIISHTGTDRDALALAQVAADHHVPLIVISGAPKSPIAKLATVLLVAIAEETQYRVEALHALIAQLSLMDTLFILCAVQLDQGAAAVLEQIRATIHKTRK